MSGLAVNISRLGTKKAQGQECHWELKEGLEKGETKSNSGFCLIGQCLVEMKWCSANMKKIGLRQQAYQAM